MAEDRVRSSRGSPGEQHALGKAGEELVKKERKNARKERAENKENKECGVAHTPRDKAQVSIATVARGGGMMAHLEQIVDDALGADIVRGEEDTDESFGLVQTGFYRVDVALGRAAFARRAEERAR